MMKLKKTILAISMLSAVWGGFFFLAPAPVAQAYGVGTQAERYPQMVTAAQFAQYAGEKLEAAIESSGETRRHEVVLARGVQDMRAPAGNLICQVDVPNAIRYTGTTPVHVSVYVNGTFYRRAILYYRVKVYDTVLVAARDLKPDEAIGEADVKLAEVTVDDAATTYLHKADEIAGRVPARFLSAGKPLTEGVLQNALVIEANAPVTLLSDYNGIQVTAEGIALQRGRVGDRIRVKNARSGRMLLGTVVDAHTVKVGG